MCRTLRDAAILLGALTGVDTDDAATAPARAGTERLRAALRSNGLKGARIGVARKYFGFSDAVDVLMEESLAAMKQQGATLIDPADIETFGSSMTANCWSYVRTEADLNAYLARLGPGAPMRTLQDIIDFNDRNRQKEMPYFGQDLFSESAGQGTTYRQGVCGCAGQESSTGAHRRH